MSQVKKIPIKYNLTMFRSLCKSKRHFEERVKKVPVKTKKKIS